MRLSSALATLLLLLVLLPATACCGEEEAARDDGAIVTRFFDVGSLTQGFPHYLAVRLGLVSADEVSDEEKPLYGAEGEEPYLPVGGVDELIEIVKANVEPVSWDTVEGADVFVLGEGVLVTRTTRRVAERVASYLAKLEEVLLTSVTVEVRAVQGTPPAEGVAVNELFSAYTEGASLALTALAGQRVTAFRGDYRAYVQDYDVEVSKGVSIADPIVGVVNLGLSVGVQTFPGADPSFLRVKLDANHVRLVDMRTHVGGEDVRIELPAIETSEIHADLLVRPGEWRVAEGDASSEGPGAYFFVVRVSPFSEGGRRLGEPLVLGPATSADPGPIVRQTFDVSDLEAVVDHRVGRIVSVHPSFYSPPEPPELPEPVPAFSAETLVELIPALIAPESWDGLDVSLELRYGRLLVSNSEAVLRAIGSLVDNLRRAFLWTIQARAELIVLPTVLSHPLVAPGPEGYLLDERRRVLLDEAVASGAARRIDLLEWRAIADSRNVVTSGRDVAYLHEYAVEIAESAAVANPVVNSVLDGTVLDLRSAITSTGDAANLAVRFTRGDLEDPIREVETPHGTIELPVVDVFRIRSNLRVPFGRTAIVAAGGRDGESILLLLSPTLERWDD